MAMGWMQRHDRARASAFLALLTAIMALAFSALFIRWVEAPGVVFSFYRMAIPVVFLAWPFGRRVRKAGRLPARTVWLTVLSGAFLAGELSMWATGVMLSGAVNPTLLANMAPLWVGLGAWVFFREKLHTRFWVGLLLSMAGAAAILGLDSLREIQVGLGSLLGLLAAVFYAGYFLLTQRARQDLDSLICLWISAASSTVCLLITSLAFQLPLTSYPLFSYLWFLAGGLITQVIGFLALNYALGKIPASLVSPSLLVSPVVTAVLAAWLLGEVLGALQILGGAAVLLGVVIVYLSRSRGGSGETRDAMRRVETSV